METSGARLKKLRLEKGISLEDVQKKTKIHLDILKSIEDDSLVDLNPVYIKGFVKIYCGFLGVDPGEYLSGYKQDGSVILNAQQEKARDLSRARAGAGQKNLVQPKIIVIIVLGLAFLLLLLGLVNLGKFISSRASAARRSRAQLVLPKPKPTQKIKPSKPKVIPVAADVEKKGEAVLPVTSAVSQEPGVRIGLHALDDCWVQARLDGKIIFQNILKKGRFESWSAKDKIELSLGSAGGVRLEINGKLIPSLGRKGQVLKNILITKDGLKVGK
jgi:cytoskeleton protein RodZ